MSSNNVSRDVWGWLRETFSIKTIIDIGANNGEFAEFLAGYFHAEATYVFEPLKLYVPELESRTGKIANLKIFNVALSNERSSQDFYQNSYGPASSLLRVNDVSIQEFPQTAGETKLVVDVAPLDELIETESLQPDVFIKIDVQGVEDKVIQGGKKIFSSARCVLIEMSFALMYKEQPLFEEIHSLLVDLGFRFAGIKNQIVSSEGQPLFAHCFYLRH
ncbi:MAG: FkbM family methyltransferase [Cyanosarcina radialis HA8281-LM2]|jgi:FkbM family methyltransferase|nr:FkbM family methyltransferase [Cyanosarcina radialis HA8281-LM2]